MSSPKDPQPARLEDIKTRWSLMRLAHQSAVSQAGPARETLVLAYARAIRSYVGAILQDSSDADELAQDVLLRILRGDFSGADPKRGRFRDLLKVAVRNQARTFLSKKQRRAGVDMDVNLAASRDEEADAAWDETWRVTALENTWAALQNYERTHRGSVAHTVLKLRVDHPDDDSPQQAERLSKAIGKTVNAAAARQQLHRARLRFAQLLLEEIARSLDQPTPDRVQEELVTLGLMEYVREFLPDDWKTKGELQEEAE
jgi:RNA polymerase sigma-70 factor (ECF subfamily)